MNLTRRKKFFTVMVIPHSEKTTLTFNIPLVLVQAFGFIMITGIAVGIFFTFTYQNVKHNMEKYRDGFSEYMVLREQMDFFIKKTEDLQQKMKTLEQLDKEIRIILKDDPAISSVDIENNKPQGAVIASRSGAADLNRYAGARQNIQLDMNILEQQMAVQQQSLEKLKQAVAERQLRIDATPTIWPVRNPRITSTFGYRRSPYGRRSEFHHGIDLATYSGAPIYATCDGKVTYSGWKTAYGWTVEISNDYGFTTLYGHASKLLVKNGQTVKKGEVIARVGSSGRSTGPHLHYEVIVKGQSKNPKDYLP
jgi:murein DD-endopeptidase MepM/ murein hydrolase activator NlpD